MQQTKNTFAVSPLNFEHVVDGTSFVANGEIISLWGIEPPERSHPAYQVSMWFLKSLFEDQVVECHLIAVDSSKMNFMQCKTDNSDLASTMVKFGMARTWKRTSEKLYSIEEMEAKNLKRGIWSNKQ